MRKQIIALLLVIAAVVVVLPLGGPSAGQTPPIKIGKVHARFQPVDGKIFVLLVGHDARPGETRSRADAIHIAGIDTKSMRGGVLNFPRDSWVPLSGRGMARINDALYYGGPELLAKTLEQLTGIRIDLWAVVGFEQFQGLIEDLGGVTMNVPQAVYDPGGSGARLEAGRQHLAGYKVLAYARARKIFSGGDVTRTTNQGRILIALLQKLIGEVNKNPSSIFRWIEAFETRAANNISNEELFRLGVLLSQVKPKRIGNVTVPVTLGFAGSAAVVFIQPGAQQIYARFREKASL